MKLRGVLAALALAGTMAAQVASQANSGYQTEQQRKTVANGLADPARDAKQKPGELIRAMGLQPGMTVADVARMMQIEQRPLYRRIEASLRTLRQALTEAGADADTITELIGSPFQSMNFDLTDVENAGVRLSNGVEGNSARGPA